MIPTRNDVANPIHSQPTTYYITRSGSAQGNFQFPSAFRVSSLCIFLEIAPIRSPSPSVSASHVQIQEDQAVPIHERGGGFGHESVAIEAHCVCRQRTPGAEHRPHER